MDWLYTAANRLRFLGIDDMTRSDGEAELHRAVGELDAKVGMMQEDMQAPTDDLRQSMAEN